jgi:uncharacterized repeat protein (TIGR01451 family)
VAGQPAAFKLRVVNHGPSDATGVIVTDRLPAGLRLISVPAGCATTRKRAVVRCAPPSLAAGGQVLYTLVVHNNGPVRATHVTVTDPLTAQLIGTAAAPSQGSCTTATGVVCELGTLAVGASAQIVIAANVAETASGSVSNTANVVGAEIDRNPYNNSSSASIDVHPIPGPPTVPPAPPPPLPPEQDVSGLRVTKHVARRVVQVGQRVSYTITVTNHGPEWSTGVVLRDTPNSGVHILSVRTTHGHCTVSRRLRCSLGTIRLRGRVTITIVARATRSGTATNVASVTSDQRDPSAQDNLARATFRAFVPARPAPPPPQVTG